jgi:hypothetical protein
MEVTQMVKSKNKDKRKRRKKQGRKPVAEKAKRIGPSTPYGYTKENLTPYGGLLPLEKFLDGVKFKELFQSLYIEPGRKSRAGSYFFIKGLILLLFIGFKRIYHFSYVQEDPMLVGILGGKKLPHISTFWRYMKSIGINQAKALLRIMAALRERAWHALDYDLKRIEIDIDTTIETIYGKTEGARKGHNTKAPGKKGLRPVLAFIPQTKEYLSGNLRKGVSIDGKDTATFIRSLRPLLPGCVENVRIRADGEFFSWEAVAACIELGFGYSIAIKRAAVPFNPKGWKTRSKKTGIQYNECMYQPKGWEKACRFVAMRIPKNPQEDGGQESLFADDQYKYRVFVTDSKKAPRNAIADYDKRAGAENLVGEANREGLAAIPSKNFHTNMAYFQIVMLAYNLWRYIKLMSHADSSEEFILNTVHVSRLKLLFLSAKIVTHSNQTKVKYSGYLSRRDILNRLFKNIEKLRNYPEIWASPISWQNSCQP